MKKHKICSWLLLSTLCAAAMLSCGNDTTPSDYQTEGTSSGTATDTDAVTEAMDPNYIADIDHQKTWGGEEFRVLANSYWNPGYEFTITEDSASPVDAAIYQRNKKIEEQYDVTLAIDVLENAKYSIQREVQSGDTIYDCFAMNANEMTPLAVNNFFTDLMNTENINLHKHYWDQSLIGSLSIDGKLFYATGDISTRANEGTFLMLFNKNLAAQHDINDLYQMVRDGKWTIDYFNTLITDVTEDIDGDQKYTPDDRWGFVTQQEAYLGFYYACGETIVRSDANGMPVLAMMNDRFSSVYETLIDVLRKGNKTLSAHDWLDWPHTGGLISKQIFREGRALFIYTSTSAINDMRDMADDFGVLPAPKFNEEQENYISYVYHGAAFYSIPTSCADTAFSGFILEALAEESYTTVTPEYYEVTLKNKYQRDESSAEMLDIVFRNRIWDLGYIVNFASLSDQMTSAIAKGTETFTSIYEKYENRTQKAIDSYIDAYRNSEQY